MSRTYEFGCEDCKVKLWVGQAHYPEKAVAIYSADGATDRQIKFLSDHRGHPVFFAESEQFDFDGYIDADPEEYDDSESALHVTVKQELDKAVANGSSIATWAAPDIAHDLARHSPALDDRDPAELVPYVEEWLRQRRKA